MNSCPSPSSVPEEATPAPALKIVGITDEVLQCECCGKSNLKRTVLLSDGRYYGSNCAARALAPADSVFRLTGAQVERLARERQSGPRYDYSKPLYLHGIFQGYARA